MSEGTVKMDITELIDKYLSFAKMTALPEETLQCRLLSEAKAEIESLRKRLEYAHKNNAEDNKSRLFFMDMYDEAEQKYEDLCNDLLEDHRNEALDYVCGWCQAYTAWEECDTAGSWENAECPGCDMDRCFKLDRKKFWDACEEEAKR